jgi:GNAT superfamily N-acetyltransferase
MKPLTIQPLCPRHLADAAALAAARYAALRRVVGPLPDCYEDPAELLPRLRDLARRAPGAVAVRGERLVGFLSGYLLEQFRGRPGVFSPEWANAADPAESRTIYAALYAYMCRVWVADGRTAHGVCLFADDAAASEAWHWLGFGLAAADATRTLAPLAAPDPGLYVRRAGPADLAQIIALDQGLIRHLMAAPVCLPLDAHAAHDELVAELADPAYAFWSAWDGDEAVGYMRFGPASLNACAVIVDRGTASITAAYIRPELRGCGVGAALLAAGLAWAQEAGYARCCVDFEPMNTPAARFWLAHFRLVCLSHLRLLDDRVTAKISER